MHIETIIGDQISIAVVSSIEPVITDIQSALDLMMTVKYETRAENIVINREALAKDFFIMSTGLAGAILEKFVTYQVKLAIYGDFSQYTSKPPARLYL